MIGKLRWPKNSEECLNHKEKKIDKFNCNEIKNQKTLQS